MFVYNSPTEAAPQFFFLEGLLLTLWGGSGAVQGWVAIVTINDEIVSFTEVQKVVLHVRWERKNVCTCDKNVDN